VLVRSGGNNALVRARAQQRNGLMCPGMISGERWLTDCVLTIFFSSLFAGLCCLFLVQPLFVWGGAHSRSFNSLIRI
jgi:hypothetical protein